MIFGAFYICIVLHFLSMMFVQIIIQLFPQTKLTVKYFR